MKTIATSSLGFQINVEGCPETPEEFDSMAGEPGACLDEALTNVIYRGYLNKFRTAVVAALAASFQFPTNDTDEPNPKKPGETIKKSEKDTLYVGRLLAELTKAAGSEDAAKSQIQSVFNTVASNLPFTMETIRTGGRIGKEYLDSADNLIAQAESTGDQATAWEKFTANVQKQIPSFAFATDASTGFPTRESIAFAIKALRDKAVADAAKAAKSLLA